VRRQQRRPGIAAVRSVSALVHAGTRFSQQAQPVA
jgi:hypothetical protein